jgi:hypothetical protein
MAAFLGHDPRLPAVVVQGIDESVCNAYRVPTNCECETLGYPLGSYEPAQQGISRAPSASYQLPSHGVLLGATRAGLETLSLTFLAFWL